MRREITNLQRGDEVVFFLDDERKFAYTGHVWAVYPNSRKVCIHWLCGYKDQYDDAPFENVVAAANPEGVFFHFGGVVGRSDILTEDGKSSYFDEKAKELWRSLEDVPMNQETEEMEADWQHFPKGTHREKIWHWFDELYSGGVAGLLNGGGE